MYARGVSAGGGHKVVMSPKSYIHSMEQQFKYCLYPDPSEKKKFTFVSVSLTS
jgi:hypothetical protein